MKTFASFVSFPVLVLCLLILLHSSARAEDTTPALLDAQPFPLANEVVNPPETTFLPTRDLFKPLIADPKEPRFYLSYRLFKFNSAKIHGAVGGYGDIFGLYRHTNNSGGYSWQANFGGGAHAQFDLHSPSLDLVNTDYFIGFPFSFRKGSESYRVALYHQSSHLGDEFLLHNSIERLELSFETIEVIGSSEWEKWRVYYGGDYIVHQGPTNIKPAAAQGGIEYYDTTTSVGRGRLVGGWDLKSDQAHDWSLNSSIKLGLQFDSSIANGRYIRLLVEGYKGFSPYGQFYTSASRMTYVGIGLSLGFE